MLEIQEILVAFKCCSLGIFDQSGILLLFESHPSQVYASQLGQSSFPGPTQENIFQVQLPRDPRATVGRLDLSHVLI